MSSDVTAKGPSGRWIAHGTPMGTLKSFLLGAASSGAKFTPGNHQATGVETLDHILQGKNIPVDLDKILQEVEEFWQAGGRYFHWHARNPLSAEQSCDVALYQEFGQRVRQRYPGLVLSYGASRNGPEIQQRIAARGEWARLEHAALARHHGGADFTTIQAAAELAIVMDLERQGYLRMGASEEGFELLKPVEDYIASRLVESVSIEANSTKGGANYGSSSAAEQLRVLTRAIAERNRLNLPQEVEWTQLDRSFVLTKVLVDSLQPNIGSTGRLNITILFGFSPKLPFPLTYREFRRAVRLARSLGQRSEFPQLHLTISVGAAVLPQRHNELIAPLDIGSYRGVRVPPLERLIAYACQPDSDVDLLRFGLEDHPYLPGDHGAILPATNLDLMRHTIDLVGKHGGQIITDPIAVRHFAATEARPYVEVAR